METDRRPLLVFFRNARSGPARRMESLIAHVARKERSRLKVREIDIDEQTDLAERFQVETVPTLVRCKDRRVVGRLEGGAGAPGIAELLEQRRGELAPA